MDNGTSEQKFWVGVEESDGYHPKPHKLSLRELGIRNVVVAARVADRHKTASAALYFPFGAFYSKAVFRWIWQDTSKRKMRS